jgi:hypothetical protein
MAWYVLGGVRLNPLLRSTGRIDLDIEAGAGRDHSWAMGRYVTDDDAPSTYTIVRFEATALGSAADHFGIGPRVRWELQPVFVHEVTYTNGVDTDRRGALALRGSTIIVALVMEADGPRETNHVSWDIGVGVAAAGDFGRSAPLLHTGFAWTWDPRPARSAPGR